MRGFTEHTNNFVTRQENAITKELLLLGMKMAIGSKRFVGPNITTIVRYLLLVFRPADIWKGKVTASECSA
jgi:hypothetical protein